ncbi:MAG: zinc-dependent alcohol dehydrogenase [Actinomycetes bacterium]
MPGGTAVTEVPDPHTSAEGVVVAVEACGICGSDVHLVASGGVAAGQVLGHEFSGRVVATGGKVRGWRVGAPVAVNPVGGCGGCPACRAGLPFRCPRVPNIGLSAPGAYAEYVAVPAAQLVALPEEVHPEVGAYAEPLAVALRALDLGEPGAGDAVLVYGVGAIGLNVVMALRLCGVERVVAVGRSAVRRDAAAAAGADVVLDSGETDLVTWARDHDVSFRSAYECSGATGALAEIMSVLRPGGRCVQVALRGDPETVDVGGLVSRGLTLVGSCAFRPADYAQAVEHLLAGRVSGDALVSHRVPLEATPDTLTRLQRPGGAVRVLVQPSRSASARSGGEGAA